jgi:hypothetical protein
MSQPALSGPIHAVPVDKLTDDDLFALRKEISDLRSELEDFKRDFELDRNKIGTLLHALRAVLNGNAEQVPVSSTGTPMPQSIAAWQMWKDRLPPACVKVIDALLIQPLSQTQLIRAAGIAHSTVKASIAILKNNTLVEKDGGRWKLRRL